MAHSPAFLTICILLLSVSHAVPDDWTRFRGPNGTGTSDATTVPVEWTEQDYNWKVSLPDPGHSSPVVWRQQIYLTCSDEAGKVRTVVCLDVSDGSILWQRDFPGEPYQQHPDNGCATATPAVDEHGVVITWNTPEAVVLMALTHDGQEVWRRDLGPFVGPHGTGTSPIIVDGLVVLANEQEDFSVLYRLMGRQDTTGPAGESFIVAVDRLTGESRWQIPRKSTLAPYSTPCVRYPENEAPELIFSSTSHGITAVDVATGAVRWQVDNIFDDRCVASPVVGGDLVIATYGSGLSGRLLVAARPGSQANGYEPSVEYEVKHAIPLVPTPLVWHERVFLWADNGVVSCLDLSDGREVWRKRVRGDFFGSPVCVAGRLYGISKEGEVVVLAASDEFEELARIALNEDSFATPAVADGVMYLRTRTHLYSLGGRKQDP